MKKLLLIFVIIVFGCDKSKMSNSESKIKPNFENQKNIKEGSTLLKYTVLEEDVYDAPIKTEIITHILLDKNDSITSKKLRKLLFTLYDERKSRTGFEHHLNPNTVAVYAFSTKEKAKSGMGQWVAMISKLNNTNNDGPKFKIDDIEFNSLYLEDEMRWGFSHEERQEIWNEIIFSERYGTDKAFEKYPLSEITEDELAKAGELASELEKQQQKEIIDKYKIHQNTLDSIGVEGLSKGWPFPE